MERETATPPPSPEESLVSHVRGMGVQAFRAMMLASLLPEQLETVLVELGPEAAGVLRGSPAEDAWVSTAVIAELFDAFHRAARFDSSRVRGEFIAEMIFAKPGFSELRGSRAAAPFLRSLPALWAQFHRGGRLQVERIEPRGAELTIWARFPYPEYLSGTLTETLRVCLALLGLSAPSASHLEHRAEGMPDRHVYRLAWQD